MTLPIRSSAIKVVVFDFDGVLVESNAVKRDAYFQIFRQLGNVDHVVAEQLNLVNGTRFEVIERVLQQLQAAGKIDPQQSLAKARDDFADQYNTICEHFASICPEIAGASACLAGVSNRCATYVNSATWQPSLRRIVQRRGWKPYFRDVLGSPPSKAENLTQIIDAEAVTPEDVLFIGDGRCDVDAATQFGCQFVGIRNRFNDFSESGLYMVDDLHAVTLLVLGDKYPCL